MAAKELVTQVKLQVPAGSANPAPPVGPALGQHGLNIQDFCKQFNDRTKDNEKGLALPVIINVYKDRSFDFVIKSTPASILLKKAAGIQKGSPTPQSNKVGKVTKKQLEDIRTKIDNRVNTLGDGPQRKTQFTQEDIAGILDGAFTANGGTPYVAIENQISNMLEMKGYEINERTKAKIDNYITQNFSPQSQRVKLSRDPNTEPANNRQRAIIDSENIRDGMAILLALPEQSRTNLSPKNVEIMANTFKLTGTFDVEAYKALLQKQLAVDENYRKQHGAAVDVIKKLKT